MDWIKLHRKSLESAIFAHPGLWRLWSWLLMRANWKPAKWLVPGTMNEIQLSRGQLIVGRKALWDQLYGPGKYSGDGKKPSERTLWRWVKKLEEMGALECTNVSNRCTLIQLRKFNLYQGLEEGVSSECPADDQPMSDSCPSGDQPVSTAKEGKKVRRKEGKKDVVNGSWTEFGQRLLARWNEVALQSQKDKPPGMREERHLAAVHESRMVARSRDGSLSEWERALEQAPKSKFVCGQVGSFRGTLKWFLDDGTIIKLADGEYEDWGGRKSGGATFLRLTEDD